MLYAQPGQSIFQTDYDRSAKQCRDWLKIYDGPDSNDSSILDTWCGRKDTPWTYFSSSNQMRLDFEANGSRNYRGFKVSWMPEEAVPLDED